MYYSVIYVESQRRVIDIGYYFKFPFGVFSGYVSDELSERGYAVRLFDLKKSPYLRENQEMIVGDMLDVDKVNKAVEGCDAVYHFAGMADLDAAADRPLDTIKSNILATANVLDACVNKKVKRFVYASTVYVYSSLGGFYKCSKQAAESYIEEYQKKYGLDFTILRFGTVYGPRADERNSVYRCLKQAVEDGKIVCRGTGDELREYVHVKDVAKLSVDILSDEFKNQHVIITGQHPTKYRDMLNTIKEMLGNKVEVKFTPPPKESAHYNMTPYSFTPKIGKKLVNNYYVDLGQGLLECLEEIQRKKTEEGSNA